MTTTLTLHPHKDETPSVNAYRINEAFWIDIKFSTSRVTIFADDAEHQQAIMAALKGDA